MTEPEAYPRLPQGPSRRRRIIAETAVVIVAALVSLVLISVAYFSTLGQPFSLGRFVALIPGSIGVLLSWQVGIWVAATITIAALANRTPRRYRALMGVVAGFVAAGVQAGIEIAPMVPYSGWSVIPAFAIPHIGAIGTFTLAVAAGWLLVTWLLDEQTGKFTAGWQWITIVTLVAGSTATLALFAQHFQVYFRIGGQPADVQLGDPESTRYAITATTALVLLVISAILAGIRVLGPRLPDLGQRELPCAGCDLLDVRRRRALRSQEDGRHRSEFARSEDGRRVCVELRKRDRRFVDVRCDRTGEGHLEIPDLWRDRRFVRAGVALSLSAAGTLVCRIPDMVLIGEWRHDDRLICH